MFDYEISREKALFFRGLEHNPIYFRRFARFVCFGTFKSNYGVVEYIYLVCKLCRHIFFLHLISVYNFPMFTYLKKIIKNNNTLYFYAT
jgi:hypothetical protein